MSRTMSPTIGKLADALCKAQHTMKPAIKDTTNPFFKSKYADLSAVWDAIRTPLGQNGLAVVQAPAESNGDVVILDTLLAHASGEWIQSRLCMRPAKNDPQGIGSCLTYARRYALGAITGVATEEDDDGNAATKNVSKTPLRERVMQQVVADPPPNTVGVGYPAIGSAEAAYALPPASVIPDVDEYGPEAGDGLDWKKGLILNMKQAEKPTKGGKPWGDVTFELMSGETVTANWFNWSAPWTYEMVRDELCGRTIEVEFVVKPANNPRFKPSLEHFRCAEPA